MRSSTGCSIGKSPSHSASPAPIPSSPITMRTSARAVAITPFTHSCRASSASYGCSSASPADRARVRSTITSRGTALRMYAARRTSASLSGACAPSTPSSSRAAPGGARGECWPASRSPCSVSAVYTASHASRGGMPAGMESPPPAPPPAPAASSGARRALAAMQWSSRDANISSRASPPSLPAPSATSRAPSTASPPIPARSRTATRREASSWS
mmetsp:Transcript_31358/g.100048  ORF Transcript_31358/g.100048 Transcript_31358/m.100048 type:complete len:215 (+) Transcript_31358:179-823(+)